MDESEQDKAERSPPTKELRKPPQQDMRLLDFFSGNDIQPPSMHGAFQAMAETSFARGAPDPDARLINSGAVGFVQRTADELIDRMPTVLAAGTEESAWKTERVSKAQRHRETAALLAKLDAWHVKVLRLAYGPADQIPCMKPGPALPRKAENLETIAANDRKDKLGRWRQVLPETEAALNAYMHWQADAGGLDEMARRESMSVARWLVEVATTKAQSKMLDAAKLEAYQVVREAWNAWADLRGSRVARVVQFERAERVAPWEK